jgi:hypothetical protein
MLENYGFSQNFGRRIQSIYEQAASWVHVNGYISKALPINCSIREGCPLSMLLFALCLDPLLRTLHDSLTTSSPGSYMYWVTVLAYSDDVTTILRSPQVAAIVQEEIGKYEAVSEAKLNINKSKAMALGWWNTAQTILGIQYQTEMHVLGIHATSTVRQSAASIWATVTYNIRRQARDAYCRALTFHQRIR